MSYGHRTIRRHGAKGFKVGELKMGDLQSRIKGKKSQLAHLYASVTRVEAEIDTLRKRSSMIPLRKVATTLKVSNTTVIRMLRDGRLKGHQNCQRGWWWISKQSFIRFQSDVAKQPTLRIKSPNVTDI